MLRRRVGKGDTNSSPHDSASSVDRDSTTPPTSKETADTTQIPDVHCKQLIVKPRSKRRNGLIFILGGLFGIFVALFFANQQEVISLEAFMDLNLESLIDVLPQGILKDVREFSVLFFCFLFSILAGSNQPTNRL